MKIKLAVIFHDYTMVAIAWLLAWLLRFNLVFPYSNWEMSLYVLPLILVIQGLAYKRFKLHRGLWRFASLTDLWNIFRASLIGSISIALVLFMAIRLVGIPRSIFILYPILLMFLLGGSRLSYRVWKDHTFKINVDYESKKVLLIGAGAAGDILIRDVLKDPQYQALGFIDDNKKLINLEIHGVRVLGTVDDIPDICQNENVDLIIIAIPSATSQQMQRILKTCEVTDCKLRTLPSFKDMLSGNVNLTLLREVMIVDLLGRENINLDWTVLQKGISNKKILVTGGGGSIGSELCKQIASLAPLELVVFERSEYNLYRVEEVLKKLNVKCSFVLGDLCDFDSVSKTVSEFKPDIIFHAAAYKHVPILERQPREGVINNVLGTKNIANAAHENKCEKFVLISTDKAVNPTNILGATKRVAEMYVEIMDECSETSFLTVRFGNVLDSEGSVVPLFRKQIKLGGPITVTHPDVTRYFMTIPEACQLIIQTCSIGGDGKIYVLDMGEPVKIRFLAEQMIRLSGLRPYEDIDIQFNGLRPGEKMYEELFYDAESREETEHKKIHIAKHSKLNAKDILVKIDSLIKECHSFNHVEIRSILNKLVPYHGDMDDKIVSINNRNL